MKYVAYAIVLILVVFSFKVLFKEGKKAVKLKEQCRLNGGVYYDPYRTPPICLKPDAVLIPPPKKG